MLLQAILLFITAPASLADHDESPLVQTLSEEHFSASSSYNDTVKAANVRFPTQGLHQTTSQEPWCPATRDDYDYSKEYVTVDLGCKRTVGSVMVTDPYLFCYYSKYSNNNRRWKKLATDDETHNCERAGFSKIKRAFKANQKLVLTPPVRARFFRFWVAAYDGNTPRGLQPCLKAELYAGQGDKQCKRS